MVGTSVSIKNVHLYVKRYVGKKHFTSNITLIFVFQLLQCFSSVFKRNKTRKNIFKHLRDYLFLVEIGCFLWWKTPKTSSIYLNWLQLIKNLFLINGLIECINCLKKAYEDVFKLFSKIDRAKPRFKLYKIDKKQHNYWCLMKVIVYQNCCQLICLAIITVTFSLSYLKLK